MRRELFRFGNNNQEKHVITLGSLLREACVSPLGYRVEGQTVKILLATESDAQRLGTAINAIVAQHGRNDVVQVSQCMRTQLSDGTWVLTTSTLE